jgi:hypothetical protein
MKRLYAWLVPLRPFGLHERPWQGRHFGGSGLHVRVLELQLARWVGRALAVGRGDVPASPRRASELRPRVRPGGAVRLPVRLNPSYTCQGQDADGVHVTFDDLLAEGDVIEKPHGVVADVDGELQVVARCRSVGPWHLSREHPTPAVCREPAEPEHQTHRAPDGRTWFERRVG